MCCEDACKGIRLIALAALSNASTAHAEPRMPEVTKLSFWAEKRYANTYYFHCIYLGIF